jgi:putative hemolysin
MRTYPSLNHRISSTLESPLVQQIIGSTQANRVFSSWNHLNIHQFLEEYKRHSNIQHDFLPDQLIRIPGKGASIILANHPTGISDAIVILDTLLKVRSDVKLLIPKYVSIPSPLAPYVITYEDQTLNQRPKLKEQALNICLSHLEKEQCLVIFTSSKIWLDKKAYKRSQEAFWSPLAKDLLTAHKGLVIPWAIKGKNSPLFYSLSKVHPLIHTGLIPRESLRRRFRPLYSSIGKPFRVRDNQTFNDVELKIRLMTSPQPKINWPKGKIRAKTQPIIQEISTISLEEEISLLGSPLLRKGDNAIYITKASKGPHLIREIGRLRELTFRKVKEGTGKEIDLDSYDKDFHHLILWDHKAKCIVGAYRLGVGPELHEKGSYRSILHDFYRQNEKNTELLSSTLVMGRAFVRPEYQQKIFPLFMLWQGIKIFVKERPKIRYLIGQTSLPNSYKDYSKLLICQFMWRHHSDIDLRKYFVPYYPLRIRPNDLIEQWIEDSKPEDFKRMDSIIECIEPSGDKLPMLFRRYIEQNAKCIGINIKDGDLTKAINPQWKLKDFFIDGKNGLDLGTGVANFDDNIEFTVTDVDNNEIGDGEPDLLITQVADPSNSAPDEFWFVDASGNQVGNKISAISSLAPAMGSYLMDLYSFSQTTNDNAVTVAFSSGNGVNTSRDIRFFAYDLEDFDINSSNYTSIDKLKIKPNGTSDYAFIAYNANTFVVPTADVTSQPTSTTSCAGTGSSATFSVTASNPSSAGTGGGTITYQWKKDGTNISGATSNSYTVSPITASDFGEYTCEITNNYGSIISDPAYLNDPEFQRVC